MLAVVLLWLAALSAVAATLAAGRTRRVAAAALTGLSLAFLALAVEAPPQRTLDVTSPFPAYVGQTVERREFVVETTTAPGYAWLFAAAGFCALWAAIGWRGRPARGVAFTPLLLAWTGVALALVFEKLAAPTEALALRLDGGALLGAVAVAIALARTGPTVLAYFLQLVVLMTVVRLPVAIFAVLATRWGLGTSLDVHRIEFCAHPLAQTPMSFQAGSLDQLANLVFVPQLLIHPVLAMLSAGGVGFVVLMAQRGAAEAARANQPRRE